MNTKELVDFIKSEITKLETSLKENSWDNCDDDESPDMDQRGLDLAQKEAYQKVLNFIAKNTSQYIS